MAEKQFAAREIIFRENDQSNEAYVLKSGQVEILKHGAHGEVRLAVLEPGQTFGEMGLFEEGGTSRSATARAITDAVADVMDREEFQSLLKQCPQRILPLINSVLDRLRTTNKRVSEAEQATVILDSDINKITVTASSGEFKDIIKELDVPVARLPFRIGGYSNQGEKPVGSSLHLLLPCEGPPLVVSQQHCQIAIEDGGLFLVDLGSRFNTIVNNRHIGRGKGKYQAPLQKGKNEIILGGTGSPYQLEILCE